jgi:DNA-binding CsgD family transcriptional regulator
MLALADRQRNRLLVHRTVGMEQRWLEELGRHTPEIHQCMAVFGSQLSPDEPFVMSRQIPQAYASTSPYIQECLRPQGIVDIMQHYLLDTPARYSVFAISKNAQQGPVTDREVELGGLLLPHLRRAVTISNVLDVRTIERARFAQTLDTLRCAVLLTRKDAAIVHANAAAEIMLDDGDCIQGTGGVLRARSASATAELSAAIARAAQDEAGMGKSGLAILLTEADQPVFAHVLPLTGGHLRTRLQPEAVAAVFIGVPPDDQDTAAAMAASFGLTPAETRVLASLLAGRTLAETASALGIAATTTRTHLDNIFSKTGVGRQADLMRLASGRIPPTVSSL